MMQNQYWCEKHNRKAKMLLMEEKFISQSRLMCKYCYKQYNEPIKTISIENAEIQIQKIKNEQKQIIFPFYLSSLDQIYNFQDQIIQLNEEINTLFLQKKNEIKNWINQLQNKFDEFDKTNVLDDYLLLQNQDFEVELILKQLKRINITNEKQIYLSLEKFHEEFTKLIKQIEKQIPKIDEFKVIENQNQQSKIFEFLEFQTIHQSELCYAIGFNNLGDIMACGFNKNIKIYEKQQNQFIQKYILEGHISTVTCIEFSKQHNWFISGAYCQKEESIILWKEIINELNKKQWIKQIINSIHNQTITYLLFNQKENELISGSFDNKIIVSEINYQNNEISQSYQVDTFSLSFCASLNELETYLILCCYNKIIIIYDKNDLNKWNLKQKITTENYGYRLQFINNDNFIFQQKNSPILQVYQLFGQEFKENQYLRLKLSDENDFEEFMALFPPCYNKELKLLLYKHSNEIFLIEIKDNYSMIIKDKINYETNMISGKISNNKKNIGVWNNKTDQIQIFQIF